MWFNFSQNNSGGSFDVNDKLTHNVYIEADSKNEAIEIAEDLGIYFNGCSIGMDCPCCGDRWYDPYDEMDKFPMEYPAYIYSKIYPNYKKLWREKYSKFKTRDNKEPGIDRKGKQYGAFIIINSIEDYAQFMANEYGWCEPDAYIYYKDGRKIAISCENSDRKSRYVTKETK